MYKGYQRFFKINLFVGYFSQPLHPAKLVKLLAMYCAYYICTPDHHTKYQNTAYYSLMIYDCDFWIYIDIFIGVV